MGSASFGDLQDDAHRAKRAEAETEQTEEVGHNDVMISFKVSGYPDVGRRCRY